VLRAHTPDLQFIPTCTLNYGFEVALSLMRSMFIAALVIMLLIAFADFAYERHSFFKRLRMSKEEKKEEVKNSEGNPEVKGERKKVHREIQSGSLNEKVRKTSVVLRNPTHFAVCLQYDAQSCPVPKVIEKGSDSAANRIVAMAESLGVPTVEDVALTRAIFREVSVGEPIPHMFFAPVAAILRVIEDEKILRRGA
jgi:type III secretion protein U